MYVKIRSTGQDVGMISHLLAKNPHNVYDRNEKGARVRIVYPIFTEQELEILMFVTPDPIELVKGTPDSYDITQYINDREFVTSSLFCSYLRPALGTALNGKPKAEYTSWVDHAFSLEVSFGPVASNLPDQVVIGLFEALGYEVELKRAEIAYAFKLKERSSIRSIHLKGMATLQQLLRQLFILMPVLDDYKHYYIGEEEVEKLHRYGEGWLLQHPQHELIVRRTLRFAPLLRVYRKGLPEGIAFDPEKRMRASDRSDTDKEQQERASQQEAIAQVTVPIERAAEAVTEAMGRQVEASLRKAPRLNELRYEAIVAQVSQMSAHRQIVDFGAGEGKLSERLASIPGVEQVWAIEPSAYAGVRALDRFAAMEEKGMTVVPKLATGSLFYRDERWSRHDVMILCEVIEHINEARLPMVMRTLLDDYQPHSLILTTPNQEYNAIYELDHQRMRHADHRFEWTRAEFAQFCQVWSEYGGYSVTIEGIGEWSDAYGQPTQMAIFERTGGETK